MLFGVDVPRLLRDARKRAGISQAALAARARTSQPAVARYEAGVTIPSLSTLERLLAACGGRVVLADGAAVARPRRRDRRRDVASLHESRDRVLQAARRHGIGNVRVFGSRARNEATQESDIDLLVDMEPGRTLVDLIGFQQDAEDILGTSVDAVAERFLKPLVRAHALRDARRL